MQALSIDGDCDVSAEVVGDGWCNEADLSVRRCGGVHGDDDACERSSHALICSRFVFRHPCDEGANGCATTRWFEASQASKRGSMRCRSTQQARWESAKTLSPSGNWNKDIPNEKPFGTSVHHSRPALRIVTASEHYTVQSWHHAAPNPAK